MYTRMAPPRTFDVQLDPAKFEKESWSILSELRPSWIRENISFKPLTGGFVNKTLLCEHGEESMVLRLYSANTMPVMDRDREVAAMQFLQAVGYGVEIYALFRNGMFMEYVKGRHLPWAAFSDPSQSRRLARALAHMHYADLNSSELVDRKGHIFSFGTESKLLESFRSLAALRSKVKINDEEKDKRFQESVFSEDELMKEIDLFGKNKDLQYPDVTFCHFDLWHPNIIDNVEQDKIYILDLEFANLGNPLLDLGTLLMCLPILKFMGSVRADTEIPDDHKLAIWLRAYLECRAELKSKNPGDVTDDNVMQIVHKTKLWAVVAAFYWGLQCMASICVDMLPEVNQADAAIELFSAYKVQRELLFGPPQA